MESKVTPLASFEATVVVLSLQDYPKKDTDPLSAFAPLDAAVGWGEMGKAAVREKVRIQQPFRRYSWRVRGGDLPQDV